MLRLLFVPLCLLLLAPAAAGADDASFVGARCDGPSDCPAGFTCEAVEVGCDDVVEPAPACDCLPCFGDDCPDCRCTGEVDPGGACTPSTEQRCVFEPQPCTSDVECTTPGFVCWVEERCEGSGCDCAPCPEGERCPPCDCGGEAEVSCRVVGGWCMPDEVPCDTAADCEHGWECGAIPGGGSSGPTDEVCVCDCPPCADEEACETCACDCEEAGGGAGGADEPESADRMCMPAGWEEQLAEMIPVGADDGGVSRGDGEALGGAPQGQNAATDDDAPASSGCSAAGAGAGTSILAAAAALALALRRRD